MDGNNKAMIVIKNGLNEVKYPICPSPSLYSIAPTGNVFAPPDTFFSYGYVTI